MRRQEAPGAEEHTRIWARRVHGRARRDGAGALRPVVFVLAKRRWMPRTNGPREQKGPSTKRARTVFAAAGLALLATAAAAFAQPKGPGPAQVATTAPAPSGAPSAAAPSTKSSKPAAPVKLDVSAVSAQLAAPGTTAAGLAGVKEAGKAAKALAPRVEEMLVRGLPPDLAIAAIDALGAIGSAGSSAAIAPYVRHRRAEVRRAAALALARTRGPEAATALRVGLRSSDAALRALSATGLGAAGDKDSVPDLAKALDRGVVEAAPSIGALCVGAQCDDLLARLDKVAPDTARAVLEAMLARKPALPDDVLARAVSKVNPAVGTSAKTYFSSLAKAFKGSKKVQRALDAAAHPPRETKP